MTRFLLYLITASYLKPSQIVHFIKRALFPTTSVQETLPEIRTRSGFHLQPTLSSSVPTQDGHEFRFLNQSKIFPDGQVDWHCQDMPKLWRYNLHYFDYMDNHNFPVDFTSHLIHDWISQCPQGTPEAWEPYTTSLRMVNWIKVFTQQITPHEAWRRSLYLQARWLERNIEYHILANHYLKNGIALFFAGAYFEGIEAERWLAKGLKILREEAEEQFLSDGGHFERSPMYHSIAVEDYLDVLNIMTANPRLVESADLNYFKTFSEKTLDFLHDLCLPDRDIPLFNDSAFGIAPTPPQIFEYAQQIIGYEAPKRSSELSIVKKEHSGYYVIRHAQDMLVIDSGPIGPDYQPGHAHSDTLSYELSLAGSRVVVDAGVHDYEAGARRQYARSTKAHNTVVVDGQDQSEMWGTFRVARRAHPIHASLVQPSPSLAKFEGSHDGYHRLQGKVTHHRTIEYTTTTDWVIRDDIQGTGVHSIENFIHLHPDLRTNILNNSVQVTNMSGKPICLFKIVEGVQIQLEKGYYFPEFGMELKNDVIVLKCEGPLPLQTEYKISKIQ